MIYVMLIATTVAARRTTKAVRPTAAKASLSDLMNPIKLLVREFLVPVSNKLAARRQWSPTTKEKL